MRLFISISVPDAVKEEIILFQKKLRQADLFNGSYVKQEQLHSTLLFLGTVDENCIPELIAKLETITCTQFTVTLDSLGANSWQRPHVIWVTLESPQLEQFSNTLHACLGYKQERKFKGHVTIARIKTIHNKRQLKEIIQDTPIKKIAWQVTHFALQQSQLSQMGAQYIVLKEFTLIRE